MSAVSPVPFALSPPLVLSRVHSHIHTAFSGLLVILFASRTAFWKRSEKGINSISTDRVKPGVATRLRPPSSPSSVMRGLFHVSTPMNYAWNPLLVLYIICSASLGDDKGVPAHSPNHYVFPGPGVSRLRLIVRACILALTRCSTRCYYTCLAVLRVEKKNISPSPLPYIVLYSLPWGHVAWRKGDPGTAQPN
jgi:hypothetical protein